MIFLTTPESLLLCWGALRVTKGIDRITNHEEFGEIEHKVNQIVELYSYVV